jgi:DNA mismatch repair protein MutS
MAKAKSNDKETPLMRQFNSIKAKYPSAILLFRVGDFYETFGEDARITSKVLDIVLTKRSNGKAAHIDLAGIPHHALDSYLPKLVRAGHKVAICDQLEDPKLTKKIVKRGVTELVTPGLAYNDNVLENKKNNFLASIEFDANNGGISLLDISTGEFFVAEGKLDYLGKLLQSFKPSEIIIKKSNKDKFAKHFGDKFYITSFDDWVFTSDYAYDKLIQHFKTASLKGFGIEHLNIATIAAGAAMHYLSEAHHKELRHIGNISRIEEDQYVWLDEFTIRNLELLYSVNHEGATLISILDRTNSPMGSRMLKRWIALPLKDKQLIEERHQIVEYFCNDLDAKEQIASLIKNVGDLERLISRVSIRRINPRELAQVKRALDAIPKIKSLAKQSGIKAMISIADQLNPCNSISAEISKTLKDDAGVNVSKGNIIKDGVNEDLDYYREIRKSARKFLNDILIREIENTGISSLKISYNNVFGYFLEVTNKYKNQVPQEWIRKQTLTTAERYITQELKDLETKILSAEEKILELEVKIFEELVIAVSEFISPIQLNASLIAKVDCLVAFSENALENNYIKPEINESYNIDIKGGRHPVIEKHLPFEEKYVDNDVYLDNDNQQIIILTGPNMSGKSAFLRQTALIVLMAQIGSFVPAKQAKIGLVDKIFTRVGASDNISSGESTFMVEMNETASILNNISNRSLILLDEIGRGTSTYDGISIAWAIAEFLHEHPAYKSKVLFATHYHELNELVNLHSRIKNYHVSVKEIDNEIIFLRKIKAGGSEHSFGIHVARMAGMPKKMLKRSEEILSQLEKSHSQNDLGANAKKLQKQDNYQLSFIQLDDPLLEQIKDDILNTDIDTLTPVEALMKLNEIKRLLKRK